MYRRIIPAAVIVLTGLLIFSYWHFRSTGLTDSSSVTDDSSPDGSSLITTASPVLRTFKLNIPWIGTVETQSSVNLIALVSGRVETIYALDQSHMEKGQPVMRLGGVRIGDTHEQLLAEIESLERQLDLTRQTVKRHKETLEKGVTTSDPLAAAQELKARLDAQLSNARLNLKSLENQIMITSPIKGIFTNRQVNTGQDVSAGQIVGEVIDTGSLKVVASLFLSADIEIQDKDAVIRLSKNRVLGGIVRSVLPQSSNTGATTIWIEGPQIDEELHPGQTVEGDIVAVTSPDSLAVPESAVVYDAREHPYLFVSKGSAYEPVSIRVGLREDGWVQVLSGLSQDQTVVTRGSYELFYRKFNEQFKVRD